MCHDPLQQKQQQKQQSGPLFDTTTAPQYAEAERPFDHFAERPQRASASLLQDGVNCGCFASAIAVRSLWNLSKEMGRGVAENVSRYIAKSMEYIGEGAGVSSVGDMFDADALAASINTFSEVLHTENQHNEFVRHLRDEGIDPAVIEFCGTQPKLLAKSWHFEDAQDLLRILTEARNHGAKVMLPYYAGGTNDAKEETFDPTVLGDTDREEKMKDAHWSVIELQDDGKLRMFEGSGTMETKPQDLQAVAASNLSLADEFSWGAYLSSPSGQNARAGLESRMRIHPRTIVSREDANVGQHRINPESMKERVNLRGRIIIVGIAADQS